MMNWASLYGKLLMGPSDQTIEGKLMEGTDVKLRRTKEVGKWTYDT